MFLSCFLVLDISAVTCYPLTISHQFRSGAYTEDVDDHTITHVLVKSIYPASQPGSDTAPQDTNIEAWSGRALVQKFTSQGNSQVIVVKEGFFEL